MTGLRNLEFGICSKSALSVQELRRRETEDEHQILIVWLALGLLAAGGCAGPKVVTDFDPSAEFSAFRTFAFAGLTDRDQGGVLDNSLMRKRIEEMVGRELTAKGLRQVGMEDRSDLLVHFWVGVKDKQQSSRALAPGGGSLWWQVRVAYRLLWWWRDHL